MTQPFTRDEENLLFGWFEATTGRSWESLSEAECIVWRVYLFELQVANGGFHQALLNDGDRWEEILRALRRIEAAKITQMFEEALTVFPNGTPAPDGETRYKQVWAFDNKAKDLLWRLTCEYYDLYRDCPDEDSYAKMYAFLKREHVIE